MVTQVEAVAQYDLNAAVAVKSTWCSPTGVCKATQVEAFQHMVSKSTQCEDPVDCRSTHSMVEVLPPKKAMSLVPGSSARASHEIHQDAEFDSSAGGSCKIRTVTRVPRDEEESCSISTPGSPIIFYACGCCSLAFQELKGLTSHVLTCPWREPYQCHLCLYLCMDWREMQAHITDHISETPAECPFCEYTLRGRNWLTITHVLRHVGVKQFMCNVCRSTFISGQDLFAHVRRCHTIENRTSITDVQAR